MPGDGGGGNYCSVISNNLYIYLSIYLSTHPSPTVFQCTFRLYLLYNLYTVCIQALGAFSVMQRSGRQASYQGGLVLVECLGFTLLPTLAGVCEAMIRQYSTFSLVVLISSASIVAILVYYDPLAYFTDRTLSRSPSAESTISTEPSLLPLKWVRHLIGLLALFFALVGLSTFIVSTTAQ